MTSLIFRTIFFYFFIAIAYRIMGKREVGQLGIIDLIVTILIAELVAINIGDYNNDIWMTIFPIVVLVLLEIILGYFSVKSRKVNKLFGGKPTLLISNGKLIYNNLINQRYSIDDLLLELRLNGVSSIEDVEYAILETNGKLSVFKYDFFRTDKPCPLPIVVEGVIQKNVLKEIGKTENWLFDCLNENNLELCDVFYALYKKNHLYIIKYR
ncbi:MAG: DUF421 domain-containing protein [Bacilli bacterium]|nr:DUF421 domain-containing protein [Bacilli bacterium]